MFYILGRHVYKCGTSGDIRTVDVMESKVYTVRFPNSPRWLIAYEYNTDFQASDFYNLGA